MKNLLKISMVLLCLHCNFSALGSDKPSWVNQLPKDDAQFNYYIGRSSSALMESEGFTLATINAREQAISQNFGIYTQIRSETYQGMETSLSSQNTEAISQQVRLEEFEQVDFYLQKDNNKYNVWTLFKYSKSAIRAEKNRLSSLKQESNGPYNFMISGNKEDAKINGTGLLG